MSTYVVGNSDPSITYLPLGNWSAVTGAQGEGLMQGGYPGQIQYTFSVPASGFQWFGCKSGSGGTALICFDCNCTSVSSPSSPTTSINFTDFSVGDNLPAPTLLYQTQLSYGVHNVCISNSFERMENVGGIEQGVWGWIYTEQFVLDTSNPGTLSSTATSTSTSTTSTLASSSTSSIPAASPPATPTQTPSSAPPAGAIAGGVLGGLAFLLLLSLVVIYYLGHCCNIHLPFFPAYRGRMRRERLALDDEGSPPPTALWSARTASTLDIALSSVPGQGIASHARMLSSEQPSAPPTGTSAHFQSPTQRRPYAHSPTNSQEHARTSPVSLADGGSGTRPADATTIPERGSGNVRSRPPEPPSYDEAVGVQGPERADRR
ncbi:hypothetical protein CALVIDRAFT_569187 [Calocera viscosa TUFC12733]|uniref:Uncharacterized protein n=1 Tax=Calocera viscosa (strain TUFC12733) TaxID=1330018 RepID=A0A167G9K1_CALVF|nr:hypothetical protein CALVIDRAFT_569187 [Calocera viscosa TUFC12733]